MTGQNPKPEKVLDNIPGKTISLNIFRSESRPAFTLGSLKAETLLQVVAKAVAPQPVSAALDVVAVSVTSPLAVPLKDKPVKVKLTREEKDAKIKPMKDRLGELSTGIDTYQKQQERKKLLLRWRNVEADLEDEVIDDPLGEA